MTAVSSNPLSWANHILLGQVILRALFINRKAKELEEVKKKVKEVGIESDMSSLKKSLAELEKERAEAEKKWEEIQKQEKVRDFHWNVIL